MYISNVLDHIKDSKKKTKLHYTLHFFGLCFCEHLTIYPRMSMLQSMISKHLSFLNLISDKLNTHPQPNLLQFHTQMLYKTHTPPPPPPYLLSSLSLENSSSWNMGPPRCFLFRQLVGRVGSLSNRLQSMPTLLGAGKWRLTRDSRTPL